MVRVRAGVCVLCVLGAIEWLSEGVSECVIE
jgi:hypothetical protein